MLLYNATPLSMLLEDLNRSIHRASNGHNPKVAQPLYRTSSSAGGDMIEVELPGVDKSNVSLDMKGETLHIVAKRMTSNSGAQVATGKQIGGGPEQDASVDSGKKESGEGEKVEVEYVVRFNVGKRADTDRVSANMKNGLLHVVVPAKSPQKPEVRKVALD